MTVLIHYRDIDFKRLLEVIKELLKLIRKNAEAGKKTFVYF